MLIFCIAAGIGSTCGNSYNKVLYFRLSFYPRAIRIGKFIPRILLVCRPLGAVIGRLISDVAVGEEEGHICPHLGAHRQPGGLV